MYNSNFSNAQILVRDAVFQASRAAAALGATVFITNEVYKGITRDKQTVGFVFDVLKDEAVTAQADITDHYVEANYAIHNHIAIRPLQITISGFKSEVTELLDPSSINDPRGLATIQSNLRTILKRTNVLSQLVGSDVAGLQADAQEVYNTAEQVATVATNTAMWQMLDSKTSIVDQMTEDVHLQTKQEKAFQYLYDSYLNGDLFFVQTPFGMFPLSTASNPAVEPNMAIQSIRAIQNDESTEVSDFEVTFKEIRVANTEVADKKNILEPSTDITEEDKKAVKKKDATKKTKGTKGKPKGKGAGTRKVPVAKAAKVLTP